jgi:hypothetical protein
MFRQSWYFAADTRTEVDALDSAGAARLLAQLPGVRRVEACAIIGSATGAITAGTVVEACFESEDAMNAAFASARGKEASRILMASGGRVLDILVAEVTAVAPQG